MKPVQNISPADLPYEETEEGFNAWFRAQEPYQQFLDGGNVGDRERYDVCLGFLWEFGTKEEFERFFAAESKNGNFSQVFNMKEALRTKRPDLPKWY